MTEAPDEMSLWELYLIVRSGFRWIVGISLAVALCTFVTLRVLPETFAATATVQVSPLQFTNGNQTDSLLDLRSVTSMSFATYRRIAMTEPVLKDTMANLQSAHSDLTVKRLLNRGSLAETSGAQGPLTVNHQVSLASPELAATAANAWARATVDALRRLLTANVTGVTSNLQVQAATLSKAVADAQSRWADYQRTDDRSTIQAELSSLDDQTASLQSQVLALDREIARANAQQKLLQGVIGARQAGRPADVRAQLDALANQGVLQSADADALANAIASLPPGVSVASQDVATLLARTQLQQQALTLAADSAERTAVQAQLTTIARQTADLRSRLAGLDQKAQQLQQTLTQAQQAYSTVTQVVPQAQATKDLVPAMAGILSAASAPLQPTRRRVAVYTAVAFVLSFFAALLVVFVRAALLQEAPRRSAVTHGAHGTNERERAPYAVAPGQPEIGWTGPQATEKPHTADPPGD